jgi:hypothetical protein
LGQYQEQDGSEVYVSEITKVTGNLTGWHYTLPRIYE